MSVYGYQDDSRWDDFKEGFRYAMLSLLSAAASIGLFMFAFSNSPENGYAILSFFAGAIMLIPTAGFLIAGHKVFSPPESLGARIRNLPWSFVITFHEWRISRIQRRAKAVKQRAMYIEYRNRQKTLAVEKKAELSRLMLEERKQIKAKLLSGGEVSIAADQSLASQGALSEVDEHPYGRSAEHAALNAKVDEALREVCEDRWPGSSDEDYESPSESYEDKRRNIYRRK